MSELEWETVVSDELDGAWLEAKCAGCYLDVGHEEGLRYYALVSWGDDLDDSIRVSGLKLCEAQEVAEAIAWQLLFEPANEYVDLGA